MLTDPKNLFLKYRADKLFLKVLSEQLKAFGIDYKLSNGTVVILNGRLRESDFEALKISLEAYGIEIVKDLSICLVQNIKNLLTELAHHPEESGNQKVSAYLADRLPYSYAYISKLFSASTHYTIEQFLILKKIDVAKSLIIEGKHSLTEIAHTLNYSSVAHLSKQFKKTTGLTPTAFYELIKKREELLLK